MRTYNMTMPELTLPSIKSLLYPLSASQNLNGYGKPWVGGAGKNLLENTASTTTSNGVTFTVNPDGTVTANGTSTGNARIDPNTIVLPAGQYMLNGCPSGGGSSSYRIFALHNGTYYNDYGSGVAFTSDGTNTTLIRISVPNGVSVSNLDFKPMIRLASDADTTFEPYENICHISGTTEVKVTRAGKNLARLDQSKNTDHGIWTYTSDVADSIVATRTQTGGRFIATFVADLVNGTTYYVGGTRTGANQLYVYSDQTWGTTLQGAINISGGMFTYTGATTQQAVIGIYVGNNTSASITDFTLTLSPASAYEPYKGDTYITDLGQTVYGGTLDITSGLLTINMARTTVGDLSWSYSTNYSYHYASLQQGRSQEVASVISSGYESKGVNGSNSAMASAPNGTIWKRFNGGMQQDATHVYIKDTAYTTPSDFKTARSSVEIVYELATPITVQLTPTQVETLAGSNTVMADKTITLTFNGQTLTGQAVTFEAEGRRVVYMFMPTV